MATTPAWRAVLQQPSFRGVPFRHRASSGPIGRRVIVYEYPKRDVPATEDMGRKAREFTIEAYVIGPEYHQARDALIAALEEEGPGELVHPTRGRQMVRVQQATCSESAAEGGMATFSITFVEAGEDAAPDSSVDTTAQLSAAADTAQEAAIGDFEDAFSTDGQPEFVRDGALADVQAALDGVYAASRAVLPDLAVLADFTTGLSAASGTLSNIIGRPGAIAEQLFGHMASLSALSQRPLNAFTALRRLFSFGADMPRVKATTVPRTQQAANQAAVIAVTRRAAVIEAARTTTQMEFASSNDAAAVRDALADALDDEMATASDAAYSALTDLRAAVVRDLNARAAASPRLTAVSFGATLPVEVIAYRIYGDATRGDEIVARNNIRHPGFVPGGQPLEILADE